jgi:murein DD-endopeptidase MepM/ murein hydrolase activator NlpD
MAARVINPRFRAKAVAGQVPFAAVLEGGPHAVRPRIVARWGMNRWRGEMDTRLIRLGKRLFPERQFVLRSGEHVRCLSLPGWAQAASLAVIVGVIGSIGGLAGAYHNLHKAIHRKEAEIDAAAQRAAKAVDLQQQIHSADEQYFSMAAQFDEMRQQLETANADNDTLREAIESAEARAVVLDKERLALETRLHAAEKALAGKSGNLSQLGKELSQNRASLRDAELARNTLQAKLKQLQHASQTAIDRTAELKLALTAREQQLKDLAAERDRLRTQLVRQPPAPVPGPSAAVTGGSELERLLSSTGVDLNRLLGRLSVPAGQGGPFVAAAPRRSAEEDQKRNEELQSLARSLPLAAPLAHYQMESGFGPRVDPFRHRTAFHSGVDLSAPYKSPVLSTAPGTVTFTGVKDDYGRVVEITHAHGIVTRYAHLHRILVARGQTVRAHQEIGELGSTGRSTGPHVHYEVLVDGTAVDPAKFLEAGKSVQLISGR